MLMGRVGAVAGVLLGRAPERDCVSLRAASTIQDAAALRLCVVLGVAAACVALGAYQFHLELVVRLAIEKILVLFLVLLLRVRRRAIVVPVVAIVRASHALLVGRQVVGSGGRHRWRPAPRSRAVRPDAPDEQWREGGGARRQDASR